MEDNILVENKYILDSIKNNKFELRDHAGRRGDERLLSRQNVINIVNTLIESKYQEEKYTHWYIGFLDEKQPGGFTAVINEGVWIVTIFKRKLSVTEKKKYKIIYSSKEKKWR